MLVAIRIPIYLYKTNTHWQNNNTNRSALVCIPIRTEYGTNAHSVATGVHDSTHSRFLGIAHGINPESLINYLKS